MRPLCGQASVWTWPDSLAPRPVPVGSEIALAGTDLQILRVGPRHLDVDLSPGAVGRFVCRHIANRVLRAYPRDHVFVDPVDLLDRCREIGLSTRRVGNP